MREEFKGKVENREGKLILSIGTRATRAKFSTLLKLLSTKKVDVVEVKNHDTVVCLITVPTAERLPVGEVKIE